MNELVSNSLRHAFSDGRTGRITVTLERQGQSAVVLTVADSGPGFPAGQADADERTTGLQLVRVLCGHLGGVASLSGEKGMHSHVVFTPRS